MTDEYKPLEWGVGCTNYKCGAHLHSFYPEEINAIVGWNTRASVQGGELVLRLRCARAERLETLRELQVEPEVAVPNDHLIKLYDDAIDVLSQPPAEVESDTTCTEDDGCPTELAVLKRFWRDNQPPGDRVSISRKCAEAAKVCMEDYISFDRA